MCAIMMMMIDFIAIKAPSDRKREHAMSGYLRCIKPHITFIRNIHLEFKHLFVSREGIECNPTNPSTLSIEMK